MKKLHTLAFLLACTLAVGCSSSSDDPDDPLLPHQRHLRILIHHPAILLMPTWQTTSAQHMQMIMRPYLLGHSVANGILPMCTTLRL